ncbi:hypothetical protein HMPREF3086_11030 [Dietzia sp. HMSC21D01]|uniref:hypothetical protein n=1 Tax=Dietzia TaxID=37914 RepID=UPI0008A4AC96|nr:MULTISPECIES: hypothetical protein [Dietzia]MCT2031576.1 hypothetical protein [Dietzia cinnamea]MCT2121981.1 hypothetical protein [Dietzia cinnamea]MCT2146024.1 hypothetical protein [Dietzia cinnamea]MCT2275738.1 hypothetical protein [Dietzia cinnamea]MCT2305779.1 hypothetical protein [Dietzia cinnamea]
MTISRIATRVAATIAASAALTVGAAGIASAATASHNVDGNTVSATFKAGVTEPIGGCVAVIAERDAADDIAGMIKNINLNNIVGTLSGERTTILRTDSGSPVALPVLFRPVTVSADNVPTGVHSLITYCAGDYVPVINTIATGDAVNPMGSVVSDGPALISSGINFF